MNFEVYAYWNTVELAAVFNAIAAITGSGDFNGLLQTLALVAILSLSIAVLAGRGRLDDFWRWVVMLGVFHGMLLVPKSNVVIVDRDEPSADRRECADRPRFAGARHEQDRRLVDDGFRDYLRPAR